MSDCGHAISRIAIVVGKPSGAIPPDREIIGMFTFNEGRPPLAA